MSEGKITLDIPERWMAQFWVVIAEGPTRYWDDENVARSLDLTWGQVAKGFELLFDQAVRERWLVGVLADLISTDTVDHNVADVIAQLALFGEVRYG